MDPYFDKKKITAQTALSCLAPESIDKSGDTTSKPHHRPYSFHVDTPLLDGVGVHKSHTLNQPPQDTISDDCGLWD